MPTISLSIQSVKLLAAELVVVILGILIALQVEEWRTNQTELQEGKIALQNILTDLDENQNSLRRNISGWEKDLQAIEELSSHIHSSNQRSAQVIAESIRNLLITSTWPTSSPTYTGLINSNRLHVIQSDSIRNRLYRYYEGDLPFMAGYQVARNEVRRGAHASLPTDLYNVIGDFEVENATVVRLKNAGGEDLNLAIFKPFSAFPRDPSFMSYLGRYGSRTAGLIVNGERIVGEIQILQEEIEDYLNNH
ncbi:MAG: hypothetical protein COA96_06935 [SAR86 cluster bacterium]|uniref:Uncharacterized protein n=1 Tax=SAR86 cluster bacterium TaxID=2030880 RepID=A0A2A5B2R0_9GAMM|nr:MAG: hypothetical protein COA96_06935 [SAR86 cluster bacterium]